MNSKDYFILFFILLASPTGRDTATACANYCGPGTRSQFCGGRKPECPEETLEVRLRLTETQSTYNIVVEVEGVIDVHYASLTSHGVQHRVLYLDGHPSRHQPRPTGLNFGEQTGTGVFPLVMAKESERKRYRETQPLLLAVLPQRLPIAPPSRDDLALSSATLSRASCC